MDDDQAEAAKFHGEERPAQARDKKKFGKMKKQSGGQNKNRHHGRWGDKLPLCASRALSNEFSHKDCQFAPNCKFEHDLRKYLSEGKAEDLTGLEVCPIYEEGGYCPMGWKCKLVRTHSKEVEYEDGRKELTLLTDEAKMAATGKGPGNEEQGLYNIVAKSLKIDLNRRRIKFEKSEEYIKWLNETWNAEMDAKHSGGTIRHGSEDHPPEDEKDEVKKEDREDRKAEYIEPPFRPSEKKRLYYGPETPILAPLTTQGNLPFRRLCISLGAELTFSEMAMSLQVIQGEQNEWALMKAHESEISPPTILPTSTTLPGYDHSKDLKFGVQLSANKPWLALKATEAVATYCPRVRVIDLNCGCPIDLVCKTGGGSTLLEHPSKIEKMLRGMGAVSGDMPISCKIRMGTRDAKPNADSVVKRLVLGSHEAQEAGLGPSGVAAITLHGRTKQQRYTRRADWSYISEIGTLIRRIQKEEGDALDTSKEVDPRDLPNGGKTYFIGNGDVLGHTDYLEHISNDCVDSVMVARGALIKPWVFEEIATGQHLDKSSSERLEYIKQFVKYGLDTWGSDERGVGTTRRFLLEWLSFACRYIPAGLLERLPQKINERPPAYKGRDDLETLMASPDYKDWIKIAEMVLGKAGDEFKFVPKHKSNSYDMEAEG